MPLLRFPYLPRGRFAPLRRQGREATAFDSVDVQQAVRTARRVRTTYQPASEFVDELRQWQQRSRDFLVPFESLRCRVESVDVLNENSISTRYKLQLRIAEPDRLVIDMDLYEHVLTQLCGLTAVGDRSGVPVAYLKRLLSDSSDRALVSLAQANVQELLGRRAGEVHTRGKAGEAKAVFVRAFATDDGLKCRALLSDRYFPIRTLDMVTIALLLASGKIGGEQHVSSANTAVTGAYMFDQNISVTGCKVGFVNPSYAFDLRNPDRGVLRAERVEHTTDGQPIFHYPGGASYALGGLFNMPHDGPKQHLVLPACRISNSETGGGSADIQPMLFEVVCTNGVVFAKALKRTHVSSIMEEANEFESNETKKKKMETVISMMTDAMRQVFSFEAFEENCRKFLKLKDTELKADRVKEVTEHLMSAIPGGDGLLDDILKSMEQFIPGRDSVLAPRLRKLKSRTRRCSGVRGRNTVAAENPQHWSMK